VTTKHAGNKDGASSSNQDEQTVYLGALADIIAAEPAPIGTLGIGVHVHAANPIPVEQGEPAAIDNPWPVVLSNGVEQVGTQAAPLITSPPAYGVTPFGQIRTASRYTLFDYTSGYGIDPRTWGTQTATGGIVTFNSAAGTIDLTVTGSSGSSARLRTNSNYVYQPGTTTHQIITVTLGQLGAANQVARWGFFDDSDGFFFELSGTDLRVVRRRSTSGLAVDTPFERGAWGDPYSTLNLLNGSRYELAFAWLGFGPVLWIVNGRIVYEHDFANEDPDPSLRWPQLPVSCEIVNTGASSPGSIRFNCTTVYLDGGDALRFVPGNRQIPTKTGISTTYAPLIGLRMRSLVNGLFNRKLVLPSKTRMANAGGRATVAALLNPTSTTGGTWTPVNAFSGVEYNDGITSYVGGTEISTLYLAQTNDTDEFYGSREFAVNGLHLRNPAFGGTGDTVIFVGKADIGLTDLSGTIRWEELG
jgi:hypothetical protein